MWYEHSGFEKSASPEGTAGLHLLLINRKLIIGTGFCPFSPNVLAGFSKNFLSSFNY
jgi:hypothetical protein